MKIALFITCMNDVSFPQTPQAVVRVLERLGHEVVVPQAQTCCGQLHLNAGYRQEGLSLARHFLDTFAGFDAIVAPSASCVGTVRELYRSSAEAIDAHELLDEIDETAARIYEFSEFLVNVLKVTDVGASFPHKVAYHPTCHSLRVLHVGNAPITLLRSVRNLKLVELEGAESCCGFGGMFALKNAEISTAMGSDKLSNVFHSGAEVLCSLDNSCLSHIGGIASRLQSGIRVMHLAEILAHTESSSHV
ncbi:MAG: (Fe-S)-binding protein [Acidimicrobiales bacterium]